MNIFHHIAKDYARSDSYHVELTLLDNHTLTGALGVLDNGSVVITAQRDGIDEHIYVNPHTVLFAKVV